MTRLPLRLEKVPILEAVFEVRFTTKAGLDASDILPGLLHARFQDLNIARLPFADLPLLVREQLPDSASKPVVELKRPDGFKFMVGRGLFAVNCPPAYPGWTRFASVISEAVEFLSGSAILHTVDRYSMKYTNVVEAETPREMVELIQASVTVGNRSLEKERFQLHVEFDEAPFTYLVDLMSPVTAKHSDRPQPTTGALVSVDAIVKLQALSPAEFVKTSAERVDRLHSACKTMFFDCLKPSTIQSLGPTYE